MLWLPLSPLFRRHAGLLQVDTPCLSTLYATKFQNHTFRWYHLQKGYKRGEEYHPLVDRYSSGVDGHSNHLMRADGFRMPVSSVVSDTYAILHHRRIQLWSCVFAFLEFSQRFGRAFQDSICQILAPSKLTRASTVHGGGQILPGSLPFSQTVGMRLCVVFFIFANGACKICGSMPFACFQLYVDAEVVLPYN